MLQDEMPLFCKVPGCRNNTFGNNETCSAHHEYVGPTPIKRLQHALGGVMTRMFAERAQCSIWLAEWHYTAFRIGGSVARDIAVNANRWKYHPKA